MRKVLFFKHSMLASILYLFQMISEMKVGPGTPCGVGQSIMGALGQHIGPILGTSLGRQMRTG